MRRLHDGEKLILVVLILHPQSEENGSHVVSHTVITFLFQHPLHTRSPLKIILGKSPHGW